MEEQSFIVRFYRFDSQQPDNAVGTVQAAESGLRLNFTGMEGLWQAMIRLQTLELGVAKEESVQKTSSTLQKTHNGGQF